MTENGVSKKLCISIIGIQAIVQMANGAEDKFKFAILIAVVIAMYKVVQFMLDRKKGK